MSLTDITFAYEYRSDKSNVVDEFYIPCFKESIEYCRAVGYFTSYGLSLAAKGLATFIQSGGHMRLVASPLLDPEDIVALTKGYEAREDIIERAILRQLGEELLEKLTESSRIRLGCLSWLISENRLDVKLALPSSKSSENSRGIYHEKIGIFIDSDGNNVAFTGSPNETVGGLVSNFESIDVFVSWDDPHGRVARKVDNFERLWSNDTSRLHIFEFPEAARERLLQFRTKQRPVFDPESANSLLDQQPSETITTWVMPEFKPPDGLTLYPHQAAAIEAWDKTEGKYTQAKRTGFLEMATGSGKTLTALCIAANLYKELGRLAMVVVVPGKVLVDQWSEEAAKFGIIPILAHSENTTWRKSAWSVARAYRREQINRTMLVVTNKTFATTHFQKIIYELGNPSLLIADEAHNLGADQVINHLPGGIEYRIALTATPRRYFDDEGTQSLFDYFGESEYQFTLKDAIGICLVPYDYFVTPVELSREEAERYIAITSRIKRFLAAKRDDSVKDDPGIARLFRDRSLIISKAEGKIAAFSRLLDEIDLSKLKHTLVYTSDKAPEQTDRVMNLLQHSKRILAHRFTEQESGNKILRQELIERFAVGDDLQVLVAKRCLDEGVDIPPTRRAYFLASTSNPRQYIQRRGRLLRKFAGKTHAIIHDLLVIPPMDAHEANYDKELSAIRSEFHRFAEFASTARNGASARLSLLEIAKRLGVTDIIAGGG
ncbi:DEAD/DEAH box helicase family protein [Chloroflexota bacterium]